MTYHDAMRFAVTVGFDAFRIAIGRGPVHHSIDTICAWLRHADARRAGKVQS